MKEKVYNIATIILLSISILLWLAAYLLGQATNHQYVFYLWILLLIIQLAVGLICGRLIKMLHMQANTDILTGLYNKRYMNKKLSDFAKNMRNNELISLMLVDIDNFKVVNDTYGHVAGDQVLKQLAGILIKNKRKNDFIIRWGGEEFALILSNVNKKEAYIIAERIRKKVEKNLFYTGSISLKITISIGVIIRKKADAEECVKLADQALYKAKEKKNLVVSL